MDCTLCIICQCIASGKRPLSCPQIRQNKDAYDVYKNFLENVQQFKSLDALPVDVDFGYQGTPDCFMENNASGHRACHQQFNQSKLEREITRKRKLSFNEDTYSSSISRGSKPQTSKVSKTL